MELDKNNKLKLKTTLEMAEEIGRSFESAELELTEKTVEFCSTQSDKVMTWLLHIMMESDEWTIGKLVDEGISMSMLQTVRKTMPRDGENIIDYTYRIKQDSQACEVVSARAMVQMFSKHESGQVDLECDRDDIASALVISILNGYKFDLEHEYGLYKNRKKQNAE